MEICGKEFEDKSFFVNGHDKLLGISLRIL